MKLSLRKHFIFFSLVFFCYSSGFCLQLGVSEKDSLQSDSTQVLSTEAVTALEDSAAGYMAFFSSLIVSAEELEKRNKVLTSRLDSVKSALVNPSVATSVNFNLWLYGAILVLSLITLASMAISIYLYQNRRIKIKDSKALVPQKWGKFLERVSNTLGKKLNQLEEVTSNNTKKLESMIETYLKLHKALDEKDAEIKRLKKGYDKELYRKYLYRFIRIDQTIDEILEEEQLSKNDLKMIKRLMEDAFFECGVERFSPEVGADFTETEGVEEQPEKVITDVQEDQYKIAEILNEGYVMRNGDQLETLVPSKVKIFVTEN